MDLKVQRKSVTSSQATQFLFDVKGTQYIVKNFTEGNIYVALKETQNKKQAASARSSITFRVKQRKL